MARRSRPELEHAAAGLFLTLLVAAVLFLLLRLPRNLWYYYLAAWLVAVNLVTFAYYAFDKHRARANGRRVPEVVLHFLAIVGGTIGAYLGMRFFRHKTIKGPFRLVFWFIVALQLALIGAIGYRVWKHSRAGGPESGVIASPKLAKTPPGGCATGLRVSRSRLAP